MNRSFHAADYSGMGNFCMLDPMSSSEPADLSIYDRIRRSDDAVVASLASGTHARELLVYLGEADYAVLAPLARAAGNVAADAPLVLVVPGIMGTQLGRDNAAPWLPNLLWLDPVDIIAGRLAELHLQAGQSLRTLGAIPYSYLQLTLRLRAAGLDARNFEYDWRHSVLSAGKALAAAIAALPPRRPLMIVAHSMGGLVVRAALREAACNARVSQVITLGAPHAGAIAPAQALRGVYPTVRRLAALDQHHDAEQLAGEVFGSFPSLHDMLPAQLLDSGSWPQHGLVPRPAMLRAAAECIGQLTPIDARYTCIAGLGQRTATACSRSDHEFRYEITSVGDGTVPADSAAPAGAATRYCRCEHSELPRDAAVAAAIVALLAGRAADCVLPAVRPVIAAEPVEVTDSVLRTTYTAKVDWNSLSPDERRRYLNQLNLAPPQYAAIA